MNKSNLLKTLEERPLRMAPLPELPRPQIVVCQTQAKASTDRPISAFVIIGFACWLVYAFMRGVQA